MCVLGFSYCKLALTPAESDVLSFLSFHGKSQKPSESVSNTIGQRSSSTLFIIMHRTVYISIFLQTYNNQVTHPDNGGTDGRRHVTAFAYSISQRNVTDSSASMATAWKLPGGSGSGTKLQLTLH